MTSQTQFGGTANGWQQSRYLTYQTKTTSAVSQIRFTYLSPNTFMNVKAQNYSTNQEYAEQKNLGVNITFNIPNGTKVGVPTRLIVTNSTWALFATDIAGWYKTN